EQIVHAGDVAVAVRADRVATFRDAADLRDLARDLLRRQHAALAGLRALRELDLEGLDDARELDEAIGTEIALRVAHAVLRRADLHDDVAAAFEVIWRKAALARVHPAAGDGRAARERAHRGRRDRAEAHAADVDDRARLERIARIAFAQRERRRRQALLL